jgi:hypothetical protein
LATIFYIPIPAFWNYAIDVGGTTQHARPLLQGNEIMTKWIVKWENGKTQTFVPYDSIGFTTFIRQGLQAGKVTVNGIEYEEKEDGWVGPK